MFSRVFLLMLALSSAPALAAGDEIEPVPAQALIGHAYFGESTPSRILFINVRDRPVRILWVSFDGTERPYAELAEGEERVQPTYLAHRWVVRDAVDGTPLEGFISTRAASRGTAPSQIAVIR